MSSPPASPDRRLSLAHLGSATARVRRPAYDPARCTPGIVHLGVGNFQRAHQAVYTDDVLGEQPDWAIVGVSLRRPDMRDALAPQDGLYTLVGHQAGEGASLRVIGSVRQILVAPEDPAAVIGRLADPSTRVVTLTVTEKGYCRRADGSLDADDPLIRDDLVAARTGSAAPASMIGLLAAACARRRRENRRGFTVVSCDNLSGNGSITRDLLLQFAQASDPALAAWIERETAFPSTMVDRIVPHTTDELRHWVQGELGLRDAWPVATESFSQWVLEDRFVAGRPAWEQAGVSFVDDVAPVEAMKLRLLNAAHSLIAYLAVPDDIETIDAAVAQPALRRVIERFWRDEAIAALPEASRASAPGYVAALMRRFENAALAHRTLQIAMDGSLKLPLRWWPTLRTQLGRAGSLEAGALGVAAWIRFLDGRTRRGSPYQIVDPLSSSLCAALRFAGPQAGARVDAVCSLPGVIDAELAAAPRFRKAVTRHLAGLDEHGSLGWLARLETFAREQRS